MKIPEIKKIGEIRPRSADEKAKIAPKSKTGTSVGTINTNTTFTSSQLVKDVPPKTDIATTTIITDSSTICIPVMTNASATAQVLPKYKTMPSPTRLSVGTNSHLQLIEIFEEGDHGEGGSRSTARQFVSRNQNRTSYEQRRSKFHKNRTASCSSSDASDDDSENRKKRAHKLGATTKPLPPRRDSHDDSSDSQEPGTGAGSGSNGSHLNSAAVVRSNGNTVQNNHQDKGNSGNSGGRKNADVPNVVFGKRHKASRRRNGETRLRESQSLNRITEVQEDGAHSLIISTTVTGMQVKYYHFRI